MPTWALVADDILRARAPLSRAQLDRHGVLSIFWLLVACGLFYGFVMGCYDGGGGIRPLQAVYSAIKVPLLLTATFALSLPSFFVVNTLVGLRADFSQAIGALLTAQAGLTIVLASLAPFTMLWYASTVDYNLAKLFNAGMFAVASVGAQALLWRLYAPLIRRRGAHRWMMWAWLFIYSFVGIQMAWIGRPFIGSPDMGTRFLREGAWSNAYVHLAQLLWQVLGGQSW